MCFSATASFTAGALLVGYLLYVMMNNKTTVFTISAIACVGIFFAAPASAQYVAGTGQPSAMTLHHQRIADVMKDTTQAMVSMAGISGFLVGPMLGVFVTRFSVDFLTLTLPAGSVAVPLAATALLSFFVVAIVAFAVPGAKAHDRSPKSGGAAVVESAWLVPKLLALTLIVAGGVGAFEVGLALRGKQELGLSPYQIAMMFTECSLVMFAVQAIAFTPWFQPEMTRWLIAPALAVLAAGLFLVPRASDFTLMLIVIGAVAASAGILLPILTYWISAKAGNAQGWELGKQTAASSLGVTLGSAAGGLLYDIAALPGASFVLTAALAALGFLLSIGISTLLVDPISVPRRISA